MNIAAQRAGICDRTLSAAAEIKGDDISEAQKAECRVELLLHSALFVQRKSVSHESLYLRLEDARFADAERSASACGHGLRVVTSNAVPTSYGTDSERMKGDTTRLRRGQARVLKQSRGRGFKDHWGGNLDNYRSGVCRF